MSEYIYERPDEPAKVIRDRWNVRIEWDFKQREEIVRCRDCKAMRVKYGNTGIECWMNGEPFTVEPNGFCAWAKRRDG